MENNEEKGKGRCEPSISNADIQRLMAEGKTHQEIADIAGVTRPAISKRIRKMGQSLLGLALYEENSLFGRHLKTLDQLIRINERCWQIIESKKTKDSTRLHAMRRVEAQNELQLKLIQALYSIHEVKEFQRVVLEVLAEVDSSLRDEILHRFKKRRSLAGIVAKSQGEPMIKEDKPVNNVGLEEVPIGGFEEPEEGKPIDFDEDYEE